jgi:hypothetical protein
MSENGQTTLAESPAVVSAQPTNGNGTAVPEQPTQGYNWRQLRQSREEWHERAVKAEARVLELEKQSNTGRAGKLRARIGELEAALREAYQRGRADLQAEMVFAERLSAIRAKYPDFDRAWAAVKPLVPRVVWAEVADLEHGLEGAYRLSKLPELATELSVMGPSRAVERFRHFVKDLAALTKGAR